MIHGVDAPMLGPLNLVAVRAVGNEGTISKTSLLAIATAYSLGSDEVRVCGTSHVIRPSSSHRSDELF